MIDDTRGAGGGDRCMRLMSTVQEYSTCVSSEQMDMRTTGEAKRASLSAFAAAKRQPAIGVSTQLTNKLRPQQPVLGAEGLHGVVQ
eukprot:6199856-Pleurochrysis_carterae.AAC.4